jgi:superfamily I DNA/RNA helicase
MKLWAATEPVLSRYDVILLDEAQDSYPVTVDFVMRHVRTRSAAVVMVGDTHQAIYGWRNATDAIPAAREQATHYSSLTECFRFNQRIADGASRILNRFKDDDVRLVGRGRKERPPRSTAIIARTNAALIDKAIELVSTRKPIHFVATDPRSGYDPTIPYRFDACLDVLAIYREQPDRIRSPFYRQFRSFEEVIEHTKDEEGNVLDAELNAVVSLVEKYADSLPMYFNRIISQCTSPEKAAVTLSSAHRAKGQEWGRTELLDGLFDPRKEETKPLRDRDRQFYEEVNLLYVALTRSKGDVKAPFSLTDWLWGVEASTASV